jgi:hypothetical protein
MLGPTGAKINQGGSVFLIWISSQIRAGVDHDLNVVSTRNASLLSICGVNRDTGKDRSALPSLWCRSQPRHPHYHFHQPPLSWNKGAH